MILEFVYSELALISLNRETFNILRKIFVTRTRIVHANFQGMCSE